MLGVTNLLTPLSYANAANLGDYDNITASQLEERTAKSFSFIMPAHDVWLYAVTAANHYFVDFNWHGETSWEMDPQEMVYDTEENLKSNAYGKTWYTFSGWNRAEDGSSTWYTNGQAVKNLTGVESGHVPLYAQWNANSYNIQYVMNDSGGTSQAVHNGAAGQNPTTLAYDVTGNVTHPSRTWYTFSGWQITNMDSTQHNIWDETTSDESYPRTEAQSFKNLRATSGTVTFTALWDADQVQYVVRHYTEGFTDGDYSHLEETNTWTALADAVVTAALNDYTWFSQPSSKTGIVNADGTTVFVYEYPRISYPLTLVPGRWIASVSASGTVTTSGPFADTGIKNYKYNEAITLSLVEADWYENGRWEDIETGFNMPNHAVTGTAVADPITYTITLNPNVKDGEWKDKTAYDTNSGSYTIESDNITLINPKRNNSTFAWWIWTDLTGATQTVTIAHWSTGDREYTATWTCHQWYHLDGTGTANEWCMPDTDTQYLVNYVGKDLNGNNITLETYTWHGTTATTWTFELKEFDWFTIEAGQTNEIYIKPDWTAEKDIFYTRNQYNTNVTPTSGITVTVTPQHSHSGNKAQYGDTVDLTGDVEDGYTFNGWTVTKSGGSGVTVTNDSFEMPSSDVTITPNVTKNQYTITYDLKWWNEPEPANATGYTVTDRIEVTDPSRPHSIFDWWTWSNGDTPQTDLVIWPNATWNKSYTAVWSCVDGYHMTGANDTEACEANTYTVTINPNGGEHALSGDRTFTYDTPTTIVNPERSWYDFAWWTATWLSGGHATVDSGSRDGTATSGTTFENLTTVYPNGEVTLTATWTARTDTEYLVIHYTEELDGTFTEKARSEWLSGETASTLTFTNLTGTFTWFTYASGAWSLGVSGTQTPATSTTIDEKWRTVIHLYYTRNDYTVHLSGDEHATAFKINGDSKTSSGFKYGDTVEVSVEATEWYHFVKWEKRWTDFAKTGSWS